MITFASTKIKQYKIMARIKNIDPKKCKRCIFYNSCQNNPSTCEDFVDKKEETADDKAKRRKEYHKWLKSIGY